MMSSAKSVGAIAALMGLLSVALGAFGAHGLKHVLSPEMKAVYQTAVQYQMFHSLAMLVIACILFQVSLNPVFARQLRRVANFFLFGIVLFCGSLFLLSVLQLPMLGAVTPIGGVSFIIGWGLLIIAFLKASPTDTNREP